MSEEKQEELGGTDLMYAMFAEAQTYNDCIELDRGDPDFDTPTHVIEAARDAMLFHANEATPPEGILPLREAIAARMKRVNGIAVDPEAEVCVTNGGVEALRLMHLTALKAGDGILFPEPNYNSYRDTLRYVGGVLQPVHTGPKDDFRIHPSDMEAAITDETRAMLLISPGNPSANVISPEDAQAMLEIAIRHDLIIFSDEIYDTYVFDEIKHASPAALPGGKARTLTLNALSKAYSMTGWRLGWVVGPADLMARLKSLKAALSGGSSVVKQYAALAALTGPQDEARLMVDTLTARRKIILEALDEMGVPYGVPQGGQFLFADISFTGWKDVDLAFKILRDAHVSTIPGSIFGADTEDYIRIAFLTPEDELREGLGRMKRVFDEVAAA